MSEENNTPVQSTMVDFKQFWNDYKIAPDVPLKPSDVYAFLNKGGDLSFLNEKITEHLGTFKIESKYISKYELSNMLNALPQDAEKHQLLKEDLNKHLEAPKQEVKQDNGQKAQNIYDYYATYKINNNNRLNKHDVYAFCIQAGKEGKKQLLDIVENILKTPVQLSSFKSSEVEEKIVNPLIMSENAVEFKNQLINHLPIQEQGQGQEQSQEQAPVQKQQEIYKGFDDYYEQHFKRMDSQTGVTHKNIYAFININIPSELEAKRTNILTQYGLGDINELKKTTKDKMIEKIMALKDNPNFNHLKTEMQQLYLENKALQNNINDNYLDYLQQIDYPKEQIWELAHVDKLLYDTFSSAKSIEGFENLAILYDNPEAMIYSGSFHINPDLLELKRELLNNINHSENKEELRNELIELIENKNDNQLKI